MSICMGSPFGAGYSHDRASLKRHGGNASARQREDPLDGLRVFSAADTNVAKLGRLVGHVGAREIAYLPAPRRGVEALAVAPSGFLGRSLHVNLDEARRDAACPLAI